MTDRGYGRPCLTRVACQGRISLSCPCPPRLALRPARRPPRRLPHALDPPDLPLLPRELRADSPGTRRPDELPVLRPGREHPARPPAAAVVLRPGQAEVRPGAAGRATAARGRRPPPAERHG